MVSGSRLRNTIVDASSVPAASATLTVTGWIPGLGRSTRSGSPDRVPRIGMSTTMPVAASPSDATVRSWGDCRGGPAWSVVMTRSTAPRSVVVRAAWSRWWIWVVRTASTGRGPSTRIPIRKSPSGSTHGVTAVTTIEVLGAAAEPPAT